MHAFDWIAEQRIEEAIARGELDGLPGEGRPLELDDDRMVPAELRMAYRILKNAGLVPPEVEARKEIASLRTLVDGATDELARRRALAKLALLEARLEQRGTDLRRSGYYDRIGDRLERA